MKHIKRISLIFFSVLILVACVPIQAFAVDPVSAATMANAFAQAITAYGASHGVSMTFDVANTDGIGEGVHDLWEQFKADMESDQDYSGPAIETFDTMSVSTWATLYKKIGNKVGIDLTSEIKSVFDGFWNWLLSGPAEMTKVDNQYYQWTLNENDTVSPIVVGDYQTYFIDGNRVIYIRNSFSWANLTGNVWTVNVPYPSFAYLYDYGTGIQITLLSTISGGTAYLVFPYNTSYNSSATYGSNVSPGWYQAYPLGSFSYGGVLSSLLPIYSSFIRPSGSINTSVTSSGDTVSIQPYVGDTVPQDVYIPDNQDVNYEPVAVEIPLDVSWDDSLFGDGTDTLTDAHAEAITNSLSDTIVQSDTKTLELADTANPPVNSGVDTFNSVLPFVDLPSFQFNFSGIWHYVREWVSSLGAWLTTMFTIWNGLPYAIVVPVYASAVIVIVLGVYKRFFM